MPRPSIHFFVSSRPCIHLRVLFKIRASSKEPFFRAHTIICTQHANYDRDFNRSQPLCTYLSRTPISCTYFSLRGVFSSIISESNQIKMQGRVLIYQGKWFEHVWWWTSTQPRTHFCYNRLTAGTCDWSGIWRWPRIGKGWLTLTQCMHAKVPSLLHHKHTCKCCLLSRNWHAKAVAWSQIGFHCSPVSLRVSDRHLDCSIFFLNKCRLLVSLSLHTHAYSCFARH